MQQNYKKTCKFPMQLVKKKEEETSRVSLPQSQLDFNLLAHFIKDPNKHELETK